jgi:hypothetical protein
MRSALTAGLLVSALVAGAHDARTLAFYLVLGAIPACAVAALGYYGELVEGSADPETGALHVGLASLALLLCLVGAAARAQVGDSVPVLGVSAILGALLLLGLQLALLASARVSRRQIVAGLRSLTSIM